MYPDLDHGWSGHPGGVEFVGAIVAIEPAQNQPEIIALKLAKKLLKFSKSVQMKTINFLHMQPANIALVFNCRLHTYAYGSRQSFERRCPCRQDGIFQLIKTDETPAQRLLAE